VINSWAWSYGEKALGSIRGKNKRPANFGETDIHLSYGTQSLYYPLIKYQLIHSIKINYAEMNFDTFLFFSSCSPSRELFSSDTNVSLKESIVRWEEIKNGQACLWSRENV
jgi:hypothetical protein